MPQHIPCEYFLIRYVPETARGEFINVGVVLRDVAAAAASPVLAGSPLLRITRDFTRVRCINPDVDVSLFEGIEAEIGQKLVDEYSRGTAATSSQSILAALQDSLSNSIQISGPTTCLVENRADHLDQLMTTFVEPIKVKQLRRPTGRGAIVAAMRREFERAGVWEAMRKRINASSYTQPGDPMKLDCGYRPNGVIRMFHAVSLAGDVEAAKSLAYSAPQLRDGVQRVEAATLELTAVVEPIRQVSPEDVRADAFESEASERYAFGIEAMQREHIRVLTVSDLSRAAATARLELRI